ncbi:MAG TPA: 3-methyl-2-oxobutanoate dehydrogenase subunit VorB [Bacteroidaceae bacterium]|nr:3-methyl-2-oxobutanoate dehydrogenase subunit VorB [Bacteroidaceae bacterium]
MEERELKLMKGNEAIAEAAIRAGADAFYGYPITPQTEVMEYLMETDASARTGMVVLQAESEVASINMVYGAAAAGCRVMTSSSSPGVSLMSEGISYIAGAELPCLLVNVSRGGPGLGTIQPSQADYFQTVKGGGHGDYKLLTLAPSSVQEMADFVALGFDLAFKYRNPVMILSDGALGQMMEKVYLPLQRPRLSEYPEWATNGTPKGKERRFITSLNLLPQQHELANLHLQSKYRQMEQEEVRYEALFCDDAEYVIVAFGIMARIAQKSIELARSKGHKIGLFRPISLYPFPTTEIRALANNKRIKGFISVELNAGQMVEDVRLAVEGKRPVGFFGRLGGMIPTPEEIENDIYRQFNI